MIIDGLTAREDTPDTKNHPKSANTQDDEEIDHQGNHEQQQALIAQMKLKFQLDLLKQDPDYKIRFDVLPQRKIVKYQSLLKCIFYLLEHDKEDICIPGTQRLYWKKARFLWNDTLIAKMEKYQVMGPKEREHKSYQTINYIEKNLDGLTQEELNKYNYALGLVFKWL